MPLNVHVMTIKFRTGLTKVYRDALIDAGVPADAAEVKPHIFGAATVKVTDAQLEQLRKHYGDKLEELSGHSNSGKIQILLPAGEKFLSKNRPTLTDEERAASQSKGTGARAASAEVREKREKSRLRMQQFLQDRYGINLDDNKAGAPEGDDAGQSE